MNTESKMLEEKKTHQGINTSFPLPHLTIFLHCVIEEYMQNSARSKIPNSSSGFGLSGSTLSRQTRRK